jgi:uncharacterized protein YqgC (DUF456 family)
MMLSHHFAATFVIGMYVLLTSIERFTEDAYRGEKQTKSMGGLRENQWIAIAALLVGMVVTILPSSPPVIPALAVGPPFVATVIVGGVCTAFAMSMDFPTSVWRFSRLSG